MSIQCGYFWWVLALDVLHLQLIACPFFFVLAFVHILLCAMWRAVFKRLLKKVLQEDTFNCFMHVATQSLNITKDAYQPQMDVYCICGRFGLGSGARPVRPW